ncbi:MAG: hypothetical protein ACXWZ8_05380 [Gaiellaceae bacterium]
MAQRQQMNLVTGSGRLVRLAAALGAIGFASLAIFQAALAAGAPWGQAAWGGADAHLSAGRRGASAVAAVIYVAATLIVLCRAGIIWPARSNAALFRWGTWFLAVAMAIGAVPNFASQSRWENLLFGPLALVLSALCIVVARGATSEPARGQADAAEP